MHLRNIGLFTTFFMINSSFTFELSIQMLMGLPFSITLPSDSATIEDVKTQIAQQLTGLAIERQRLFDFSKKPNIVELENSKTLAFYNLKENDKIALMVILEKPKLCI